MNKIRKYLFQIEKLRRLGGRDSFFGMMEIFEIYLSEEHEKDNETGMYRFKGMEQYGNIVSIPRTCDAIDRCVKELHFTKNEFDKLIDWYSGKPSPDTKTLALIIEWNLKNKNIT